MFTKDEVGPGPGKPSNIIPVARAKERKPVIASMEATKLAPSPTGFTLP